MDSYEERLSPSAVPSTRMAAARELLSQPDAVPIRVLLAAIEREAVGQIRVQLQEVLAKRGMKTVRKADRQPNDSAPVIEDELSVLADLSELIKHETYPAIGWLEGAAATEIADYDKSLTSRELAALKRRIDGLYALTSAHKPIRLVQVDIVDVTRTVLGRFESCGRHTFRVHPPEGFMVTADEGLVELVISNAIKNSFEALRALDESRRTVSVELSANPEGSFWISIVNPFIGEGFSADEVGDSGVSTKGKARGYGIRVMRLASARLGWFFRVEAGRGVVQCVVKGKLE